MNWFLSHRQDLERGGKQAIVSLGSRRVAPGAKPRPRWSQESLKAAVPLTLNPAFRTTFAGPRHELVMPILAVQVVWKAFQLYSVRTLTQHCSLKWRERCSAFQIALGSGWRCGSKSPSRDCALGRAFLPPSFLVCDMQIPSHFEGELEIVP